MGNPMTDPAPITDEELAEIVRAIHFYCGAQSTKADRLIAALRAERAKVKELEKHIADEVRHYLGG